MSQINKIEIELDKTFKRRLFNELISKPHGLERVLNGNVQTIIEILKKENINIEYSKAYTTLKERYVSVINSKNGPIYDELEKEFFRVLEYLRLDSSRIIS